MSTEKLSMIRIHGEYRQKARQKLLKECSRKKDVKTLIQKMSVLHAKQIASISSRCSSMAKM